jgi:Putative transmembrane protein (PGPGW)
VVSYVYRLARRIAVAIIGGTLLLIGIAMIVLPGPATVVIPMGLAVLSLEFAFARRWLAQVREHGSRALEQIIRKPRSTAPGPELPEKPAERR